MINTSKEPTVPIGSIIAWAKTFSGASLTSNFVECNGGTVNDSESVLNGQAIPDLNGTASDNKFIRGAATSGGTGGAKEHSHSITLNNIYHCDVSGGSSTGNGDPQVGDTFYTSTDNNEPPYYNVTWVMRIK